MGKLFSKSFSSWSMVTSEVPSPWSSPTGTQISCTVWSYWADPFFVVVSVVRMSNIFFFSKVVVVKSEMLRRLTPAIPMFSRNSCVTCTIHPSQRRVSLFFISYIYITPIIIYCCSKRNGAAFELIARRERALQWHIVRAIDFSRFEPGDGRREKSAHISW